MRSGRSNSRAASPGWQVRTVAVLPSTHRPVGSRRLLQRCGIDGHLPQSLAGCRKNCIGNCRNDGRSPAFAHSAWRLETLNDVDVDRGCLIDAEHLIAIEIALFDTAILQRDLAMKRRRDTEDGGALDLCLDGVGIDDG